MITVVSSPQKAMIASLHIKEAVMSAIPQLGCILGKPDLLFPDCRSHVITFLLDLSVASPATG